MTECSYGQHTIDEYEIKEVIGAEYFTIVYKALHKPSNIIVALKFIKKDLVISQKQ
jgi:serine/threonine protein kinase